ncbi:patatin-like phospholipase family protein [Svornostia abyssi]|uniref:Patatin-like phospholipase family protein n=1 Tax=Svornostia abyssi TaxID=2898438 RepID=A0ABY5PHD6_9ACTN|nr:patatin-like phospholipase family protein [Parviterribacteraceae bacterium J379]
MPTAFVLAGGASLGAIEAGMVEALYEREITPDYLVGASAGALNAAFLGGREPTVATAHELQTIWRGLRREQVFPRHLRILIGGAIGRRNHFFPNDGLAALISEKLAHGRLEEMPIATGVVVCDLLSGEEHLLESGPVLDATLASSAIPGVFPPVSINGRPAVDGGVANNTPITHAIARGCDRIYVLPTGVSLELSAPPKAAIAMFVQAAAMLLHQRLRFEIEALRDQAELIVLPPPWPLDVLPTDFTRADELITRARDDARKALASAHPDEASTDEALRRMTPDD